MGVGKKSREKKAKRRKQPLPREQRRRRKIWRFFFFLRRHCRRAALGMLTKTLPRSSFPTRATLPAFLSFLCLLLFLHSLTPSPLPPPLLFPHLRRRIIHPPDLLPPPPTLGLLGEQMVQFARPDLPFTIFVPTPSSFQRFIDLIGGLSNSTWDKITSVDQLDERSLAVISRIFGFSTAPLRIPSSMIPLGGVLEVDSLSGFRLTIVRSPSNGVLTVNNLACRTVDISRDSLIVHLVDGILMDSEFEGSVMPFSDEEDEIGI